MIYTVTLNPAFDKTIYLDELVKGHINRSLKNITDIGGKGVNVSKVIKSLGGESIALGFLGEDNKGKFLKYLNEMRILNDFVFVEGETRINIKIVETKQNLCTDINQRGFTVSEKDLDELFKKISLYAKEGDIFVLSGSLPSGIDSTIYMNLINILKKRGAITILDADGEALRNGLMAKPDVVKPNMNELKMIYEFDEDFDSIVEVGKEMIKQGIKKVLISMGEKGAIYITKDNVYYAYPEKVDVKSTVGAGDAMVAAIAFGISNKMDDLNIFRLSVSSATAAIMEEGTKAPNIQNINKIMKKIRIERWI